MEIRRRKRSTKDIVFDTIIAIFLIIFVIITLYPIINTLAVSFNDGIDSVRGGIHLWPRIFTLQNYKTVFANQNLGQAAFISVARTLIGTVLSVFLTAMLAYVLSRKEFMYKKQLSFIYVLTMYVSGGVSDSPSVHITYISKPFFKNFNTIKEIDKLKISAFKLEKLITLLPKFVLK